MSHRILLLPFTEEGKDRKKPFTRYTETAAILCLAEAKRRKKPGVLGAQPEKAEYVSRLYYPIWAVPLQDGTFFVDGLGIVNSNISHAVSPETDIFLAQLEKATELREFHLILQRSHQDTFKKFVVELEISVLGLLADPELTSSFAEYAKQGREVNATVTAAGENGNRTFIAPRLDQKTVLSIGEKISNYSAVAAKDISKLEKTAATLRQELEYREEKIEGEIEELQKRYEAKLANLITEVEEKEKALTSEKDIATQRITKLREEELKPIINEKQKSETQLRLLENEKESLKKQAAAKKLSDTVTVFSLENREQENRNRIQEEEAKIDAFTRFTELFQKETDELIEKLSSEYEKKIEEEKYRITQLEVLRDSEVNARQNELAELRSLTTAMIGMIEKLIAQKQVEEAKLKELTASMTVEAPTLLYVPFYLVRLETDKEAKYFAKSPSIAVGHGGVFRKIQKAVRRFSLESRINHLLQARSKALQKLVESTLVDAINEDKSLERLLNRIARNSNVLKKTSLREALAKGLEGLRDEGWIKSEEKDTVLEAYSPRR